MFKLFKKKTRVEKWIKRIAKMKSEEKKDFIKAVIFTEVSDEYPEDYNEEVHGEALDAALWETFEQGLVPSKVEGVYYEVFEACLRNEDEYEEDKGYLYID